MIRFCCEHCGHKIAVQDGHAGKTGKCPRCGAAVVVPERSVLIDFQCENCGRKISVGPSHAGRKGKCPSCGQIVIVPQGGARVTLEAGERLANLTCSMCGRDIHVVRNSQDKPVACPYCGRHIDVQWRESQAEESEDEVQEHIGEETGELTIEQRLRLSGEFHEPEPEDSAERKLPWPVDIFLYPTSTSGLVTIAVLVIVPLVLQLVQSCVPLFHSHYGRIFLFIFYLMLYSYMFQYFVECIRDSAGGGLRAPETMTMMINRDELIEQLFKLLGCCAVFLGPVVFYQGYMVYQEAVPNSIIFWSLWAYGIFFFPMGILALVMFGSVNALNPILLIRSIISTFVQYCGLLVFFAAIGLLAVLMFRSIPRLGILTVIVSSGLAYWLLFVAGHLLGRFYWRYQQKLNWEV
jgi:DNA-directed RNA polymerase subunit RPC12/RpoP